MPRRSGVLNGRGCLTGILGAALALVALIGGLIALFRLAGWSLLLMLALGGLSALALRAAAADGLVGPARAVWFPPDETHLRRSLGTTLLAALLVGAWLYAEHARPARTPAQDTGARREPARDAGTSAVTSVDAGGDDAEVGATLDGATPQERGAVDAAVDARRPSNTHTPRAARRRGQRPR